MFRKHCKLVVDGTAQKQRVGKLRVEISPVNILHINVLQKVQCYVKLTESIVCLFFNYQEIWLLLLATLSSFCDAPKGSDTTQGLVATSSAKR